MKKVILVAMALVLVLPMFIVASVPASACAYGYSPGYWKNHPGNWPAYNSDKTGGTTIGDVFSIEEIDPYYDMTLMQVLWTKGNKDGKAAFWRNVVAQLLTSRDDSLSGCASFHASWLIECVNTIYPDGGVFQSNSDACTGSQSWWTLNDWKNYFESFIIY